MTGRKENTNRLEGPQLVVLRLIRDYIKKNGIAPTYEWIMAKTDTAKSPVRRTIERLIKKGFLGRYPRVHQNLYITGEGLAAAKDGRRRRK